MSCPHKNFDVDAKINRFEDTGRFSMDITVKCTDCQTPFRFYGVETGLFNEKPSISPNGCELRCPIGPGPRPLSECPSNIVFEVPPEFKQYLDACGCTHALSDICAKYSPIGHHLCQCFCHRTRRKS